MTVKFIEDTIKTYHEVINSNCPKEREHYFRIALENVEREARHAASRELNEIANKIHYKEHYK